MLCTIYFDVGDGRLDNRGNEAWGWGRAVGITEQEAVESVNFLGKAYSGFRWCAVKGTDNPDGEVIHEVGPTK